MSTPINQLNILVVGSKPSFTIVDKRYHIGYFANASISRSGKYNVEFVVSFLSHYIINPSSLLSLAAHNVINQFRSDRLIVLGSSVCDVDDALSMSYRRITYLVIKQIGVSAFLRCSFQKKSYKEIFRDIVKLIIKGYIQESKPSTGIASLLVAQDIAERSGSQYSIDVCGIGLSSDGYDYTKVVLPRGHLVVDSVVINSINKGRVNFHDLY